MTVRGFSSGRIIHSVGDLVTILAGPFTLVVLFRRKGSTSDGSQVLWSMSQGGSLVTAFGFNSSSAMNWTRALTASWGASGNILNAKDYVAVLRYQGDGTAPILKLKNLTDNTVTAYLVSGTSIDADTTSVPDELQSGNRVNDFPLNGNMGGWAVFEGDVGATVGDTFLASYQAWYDAAPVAMHVFNQTGAPPAVTNDLFDDTNETSKTNTTSVAGEDPANFDSTPPSAGGTDLPYDGEGKTPLLQDAPASYSQGAAYAADTRTPLVQDAPARAALGLAYNTDLRGPAVQRQRASAAIGLAYGADSRSATPTEFIARAAVSVAAGWSGRGGKPVPILARSAGTIETSADSVGPRPAVGLASYELTEPGAEDLPYDADTLTPRAIPGPARAALDELFLAYPRPALLADTPARSIIAVAGQADTLTIRTHRNVPAHAMADQSVTGWIHGPWLARGLAQATMGSGEPLPPDVHADFGLMVVRASMGATVIRWQFGGGNVAGWTP